MRELVGDHRPDLAVGERRLQERLPQDDALARADAHCFRVRCTRHVVDAEHGHPRAWNTFDTREARSRDAEILAAQVAQLGRQVRREEREEQHQPGEDRCDEDPPRAPERPGKGHHDGDRRAYEDEPHAELDPRRERPLDVADVRYVV